MHELSSILDLDGSLQQLLGERRQSLGVSLNTDKGKLRRKRVSHLALVAAFHHPRYYTLL